MTLKFGDLQAKAEAETAGKDQVLFNRRVERAMQFLWLVGALPPPGSPKSAYPGTVDVYELDVLEEAGRRVQEQRAKEFKR